MKCTILSDEIPLSRYDQILTLTEMGSSFLQSCVSSTDLVKSLKGACTTRHCLSLRKSDDSFARYMYVRKIEIRKKRKKEVAAICRVHFFTTFVVTVQKRVQ